MFRVSSGFKFDLFVLKIGGEHSERVGMERQKAWDFEEKNVSAEFNRQYKTRRTFIVSVQRSSFLLIANMVHKTQFKLPTQLHVRCPMSHCPELKRRYRSHSLPTALPRTP